MSKSTTIPLAEREALDRFHREGGLKRQAADYLKLPENRHVVAQFS